MSIAIFRHLKMTVAIPLEYHATILNFHPRRLHRVEVNVQEDGSWRTTVGFTRLVRYLDLLWNYDRIWEFHNNTFSVISQVRRNGRVVNQHKEVVPPAFSTVWTENGITKPVYEQFEQEIASKVIVERYLHEHTPNPYDFQLIEIDFKPEKMINGIPSTNCWGVRTPELVELAATMDKSESSEQWAALFLA